MDYQLMIQPQAESDLFLAKVYYDTHRPGLGADFLLMVEVELNRLARSPELFQKVYADVRRVYIKRFPYGIFFLIQDQQVIVVAVLHTKMNDAIWKNRK